MISYNKAFPTGNNTKNGSKFLQNQRAPLSREICEGIKKAETTVQELYGPDRPGVLKRLIGEQTCDNIGLETAVLDLDTVFWLAQIDTIRELRLKKAGDIACGSKKNQEGLFEKRVHEPWLARLLKELGLDRVIGIDVLQNKSESFENHLANIFDQHSLDFLPPKIFDFVFCNNLVSLREHDYGATAPEIEKLSDEEIKKLESNVWYIAKRLVKPGGLFSANGEVFMNREQGLAKIYPFEND